MQQSFWISFLSLSLYLFLYISWNLRQRPFWPKKECLFRSWSNTIYFQFYVENFHKQIRLYSCRNNSVLVDNEIVNGNWAIIDGKKTIYKFQPNAWNKKEMALWWISQWNGIWAKPIYHNIIHHKQLNSIEKSNIRMNGDVFRWRCVVSGKWKPIKIPFIWSIKKTNQTRNRWREKKKRSVRNVDTASDLNIESRETATATAIERRLVKKQLLHLIL